MTIICSTYDAEHFELLNYQGQLQDSRYKIMDARPITPNGQIYQTSTPQTPVRTGLALTEYTANPSPPTQPNKTSISSQVPEAFLLPNGFPDVPWSRPLRSVNPV